MKKLILLSIFLLSFLFLLSQESINIQQINMATATSPVTLSAAGNVTLVHIKGTKTLGSNFVISAGTPGYEMMFKMYYTADVTTAGNTFTIFDKTLSAEQANDTSLMIYAFYLDSQWKAIVLQDITISGHVSMTDIDPTVFGTDFDISPDLSIKNDVVDTNHIVDIAEGKFWVGNGADRPKPITLSSDVTMTKLGTVTVANDAITTPKILDANVTLAKVEALATGSLILGVANRPTALDVKSSGNVLVGTGTTIASVVLSGDASLAAGGALTIGSNAITTGKITDANVTLAKLEALTAATIVVGNGSNRPTETVMSGDLTISNTGVTTIGAASVENSMLATGAVTPAKTTNEQYATGYYRGVGSTVMITSAEFITLCDATTNDVFEIPFGSIILSVRVYIQNASGLAHTIDIGVDADLRGAGADPNGLVKDANSNLAGVYMDSDPALTYQGTLMANGFYGADDTGYITITASGDVSGTAMTGILVVSYLNSSAVSPP